MNILEINKFFYRRGGAEAVFLDTIKGLRERGETVAELATRGASNLPSDYDRYFIAELPELLGRTSLTEKAKMFGHLFYSTEVNKKLTALACDFKPEVAHLHNVYHHLSASLFTTLHKLKIPIVLTLHDVFPLVPNHSFMRGDSLDESVYWGKAYNCARYSCIDNKFLPSLAGTLEHYYYRARGIWDLVDAFIAPSVFMRDIMIRAGFPAEKFHVIHNFASPLVERRPDLSATSSRPSGQGRGAVVYLGRLNVEKGIKIFMEAVALLPSQTPVIVVGTGPAEAWAKEFAAQKKLTNVRFAGWADETAGKKIMAAARVVVVPSVFYENCSLTILEALAAGRLVVASNRGGNPELIRDGETGFLCAPENPIALASAIKRALAVADTAYETIRNNGINVLKEKYGRDRYFDELIKLFSAVVQKKTR